MDVLTVQDMVSVLTVPCVHVATVPGMGMLTISDVLSWLTVLGVDALIEQYNYIVIYKH